MSCISETLYGLLVSAANRRRLTASLDLPALDTIARAVALIVPTVTLTNPPEFDADANAASQSAFDASTPLSIPSNSDDVA
jgi:hypothetical protein